MDLYKKEKDWKRKKSWKNIKKDKKMFRKIKKFWINFDQYLKRNL